MANDDVTIDNLGGRLPDWMLSTIYPPQQPGLSAQQPDFPDPTEARLATLGDAFGRAAYTTKRGVRPDGGKDEGPATALIEQMFGLPKTPLEAGTRVAFGPFGKAGAKLGALVLGGLLQSSQAEAGPKVPKLPPKTLNTLGRDAETAGIGHNQGPPLVDWREAPNPNAQFPQYTTQYPAAGPPVPTLKEKPSFPGETYDAKELTPEAKTFEKARQKIMANMNKKGFEPYFDPTKRELVDQSQYPARAVDTSQLAPARQEAAQKYWDVTGGSPETRARLQGAISRGENLGDSGNWYFMAQLEQEYIKELGPQKGREAFLDEFARPMAATTSGQRPGPNLMTAHYLEYLRKNNLPIPEHSHQLPTPIGGRYAGTNVEDYNAMRARQARGEAPFGEDQPKMLDFERSMIGDLSRPVIDEQMAEGMMKGTPKNVIEGARKTAYGMAQYPVMQEAAARGVLPGQIQDIAWAGFKGEEGKPMIQIVNEAIERTHRLTGMARSEIVRRALVRKEIPLYVATALVGGKAALQGGPEQPTGE
jgi:hypothetical protein